MTRFFHAPKCGGRERRIYDALGHPEALRRPGAYFAKPCRMILELDIERERGRRECGKYFFRSRKEYRIIYGYRTATDRETARDRFAEAFYFGICHGFYFPHFPRFRIADSSVMGNNRHTVTAQHRVKFNTVCAQVRRSDKCFKRILGSERARAAVSPDRYGIFFTVKHRLYFTLFRKINQVFCSFF